MATVAIVYSHRQLDFLKAVLRPKLKAILCLARCPNICNMLQKARLYEHSATLSQRFCGRTHPWLHVQHSGFTVPVTSQRSVVLPVPVKTSHMKPWLNASDFQTVLSHALSMNNYVARFDQLKTCNKSIIFR